MAKILPAKALSVTFSWAAPGFDFPTLCCTLLLLLLLLLLMMMLLLLLLLLPLIYSTALRSFPAAAADEKR
jgi:hypothetical protein